MAILLLMRRGLPQLNPVPLTDNLPVGITAAMSRRYGKFYLETRKIFSGIAEQHW